MMDDFITAISLGFFLSFMIGPVFFILIETSITKGIKAALTFDIGVILADITFILIAYFSSFKLISKIKDDPALFIFGGGIMATYGLISYVKLKKLNKAEIHIETNSYKKNYLSLFAKGFLLNFINIGVLGFWLAIIITMGPEMDMVPKRLFLFFTYVIIAYFITDLFKIFLAKQLQSKLTPKNIIKVKKISSLLLIIFGIVIMSKALIPSESKFIDEQIFSNTDKTDSIK
ncbi:LysE family translocator [Flavobacterium sp. I3-2]|uniref:LysE family translocator n=1 Tax=Flavobacterium sp. I3-2 TaxID=2748319 RepID=UPI0015AA79CE|nr:LysE family transporter [Flavobacterium sp. I3-2]